MFSLYIFILWFVLGKVKLRGGSETCVIYSRYKKYRTFWELCTFVPHIPWSATNTSLQNVQLVWCPHKEHSQQIDHCPNIQGKGMILVLTFQANLRSSGCLI